MPYTLHDFFSDAGVRDAIPFAKFIEIDLRDGEGNLCKPRPDQIVGLNKCIKFDRYGLYDDPGCGKTVISQAYALFHIAQGNKCVVVMPPILLYQFQESFKSTFIGSDKYIRVHVLDEGPAGREQLFNAWDASSSWPEVLCLSYQMFYKLYQTIGSKGYDVLITDEGHVLANPESGIWKRIESYLGKVGERALLLMTGTPIKNELTDAYGLIELITPGVYSSYTQFERRHCVFTKIRLKNPIQGANGKKITQIYKLTGYQNVKELQDNLYRQARRVTKDQVMKLPEPTLITLPIRLSSQHHALYSRLAKERIIEIGNEVITALQEQKLRQAMLQIITDPLTYMPEGSKMDNQVFQACWQILDTVNVKKNKVIFFANYKASCRALAKEFAEFNPAIINGDSADPEKEKKKFLTDDTCRLLIANPESAGVGLNLQHVCYNAVFVEPTGVPGSFKQACERIFRGGQIHRVNIWVLKVLATLSPTAIDNMLRKEGAIQSVNRDSKSLMAELMGQKAA